MGKSGRRDTLRSDFEDAQSTVAKTLSRQGSKLKVIFGGDQAFTNGTTVVIPSGDPNEILAAGDADSIAGYTDHELAHCIYTDMELFRGHAEGCESKGDSMGREMLNALEDMRIERDLMMAYPGSRTNLEATTAAVNEEAMEIVKKRSKEPGFEWESMLPVAVTWEGRRLAGLDAASNEALLDLMPKDVREKAEKAAAQVAGMRRGKEGTEDAVKVAIDICGEIEDERRKKLGKTGAAGGVGGGKMGGGGRAGKGTKIVEEGEDDDAGPTGPAEHIGEGKAGAGGVGGGTGSSATGSVSGYRPLDPHKVEFIPSALKKKASTRGEKTWSVVTRGSDTVFSRHLTKVSQYVHGRTNSEWRVGAFEQAQHMAAVYESIRRGITGTVGVMRTKLMRALMAKQSRSWERGFESGRLDPKSLVRAVKGETNVYRRREDADAIDTAVTILNDCSGSMSGSKLGLARQASIAFALALEGTGVAYEVLGFTSDAFTWTNDTDWAIEQRAHGIAVEPGKGGKGYDYKRSAHGEVVREPVSSKWSRTHPLCHYVFKSFDERLNDARATLGAIAEVPLSQNCDGESVWWAYTRLAKRRESRKIMLVLSDGHPAAGCQKGREHLNWHLRQVVNNIEASGVSLVGIGIMSDAVKQFYPKWHVLSDVEELPKTVMTNVAKMILGERFEVDNRELLDAREGKIKMRAGRKES